MQTFARILSKGLGGWNPLTSSQGSKGRPGGLTFAPRALSAALQQHHLCSVYLLKGAQPGGSVLSQLSHPSPQPRLHL